MNRRLALCFAALFLFASVVMADTPKFDRKIGKEPVYKSKTPKYGALLFDPEGKERVWLVLDGDVLYVDRNGNGNLTEAGKRFEFVKKGNLIPEEDGFYFEVADLAIAGRTHKNLLVSFTPLARLAQTNAAKRDDFKAAFAKDPKGLAVYIKVQVDLPGLKGGEIGDRVEFVAGCIDNMGVFQFGDGLASAPAVHYAGPLQITFNDKVPTFRAGRESELNLSVASPGIGPGTMAMVGYEGTIPAKIRPVVELSYRSTEAGAPLVKEEFEIKSRCCTINFFDSVKLKDTAAPGSASLMLSFNAWTGGKVAPTSHTVAILPFIKRPKDEPISPNLFATLGHPDRQAYVSNIMFSPDGKRLVAAGYPSGIIQFWDVPSWKETRTITTPSGLRGSSEYVRLTPDWKTLYVQIEKDKFSTSAQDGKKVHRWDYSGEIRGWDLATGKTIETLLPEAGKGVVAAYLSPSGRYLISVERPGHETTASDVRDTTYILEPGTHSKRKLTDGFGFPAFAQDEKSVTLGFQETQGRTRKSYIKRFDLESGKELAIVHCPETDRNFSGIQNSPDGSVIAVHLGGKKAAPIETRFFDAKTLTERGRLVAKGDPERYGWGYGKFTPDGKRYILIDANGEVIIWNVAEQKTERTISAGMAPATWTPAISPDGKTLAVAWTPLIEGASELRGEPEVSDLPHSRVSLIDLVGSAQPRVLIGPRGGLSDLTFSPDGKTLASGGRAAVYLFDLTK